MNVANKDSILKISVTEQTTRMLWNLLNAPGVAVPVADARVGAALYAEVEAAAKFYGIVPAS